MRILAIETSCDETAVAILECTGDETLGAQFTVLGNALYSQIEKHREFGGVFPSVAKREHALNLIPLLQAALEEAGLLRESTQSISEDTKTYITEILSREPVLTEAPLSFVSECMVPDIDAIAVTHGPGLPPALWVGVNVAQALSRAWEKPLVPVNHMEGHVLSALARESSDQKNTYTIDPVSLPLLALLISGGHTELVCMNSWLSYTLLGQTLDDAVGEAFDKTARMIGLPYPGGPEISRLAQLNKEKGSPHLTKLPRPMIHDEHMNFSFSGLKTAVLYFLKEKETITDEEKEMLSEEIETAVSDVLTSKTGKALRASNAKTLTIGGGVAASMHVRNAFETFMAREHPQVILRIPIRALTTDNAIMIGMAGYFRHKQGEVVSDIRADGNLKIARS